MTVVESALVLSVFCMLLFGIFEYCRFLFVLHTVNNATRDGARYAVVNMDKPSNFDTTDYSDSQGTTFTSIQGFATARLGGADRQLAGYQVAVYAVDQTGLALSPPVIRPISSSSTVFPDPFNPNDSNRLPWNQTGFPGQVAVSIKGTYQPLLPSLLFIPAAVPVAVTGMASSEG
jgi:Flp pilus assembly protein TadG